MTDTPETGKRSVMLLTIAGITGVLAMAMLLSLIPEERREQLPSVWEEDRQWHTRPAQIVELDCTRVDDDPANECTDDGRFEITYRYRYGDDEFVSSRIAPEAMLARFDASVHERLYDGFRFSRVHSRPITIHLNQADPADAYIYPPEKVWGPLISLVGGGIFLAISLITLAFGMRRVVR